MTMRASEQDKARRTAAQAIDSSSELSFGQPAPWFQAPTLTTKAFSFHTLAGAAVLLSFFCEMSRVELRRYLLDARRALDTAPGAKIVFLGVSESAHNHAEIFNEIFPGAPLFHDEGGRIKRLYGLNGRDGGLTFLLDERLRVVCSFGSEAGQAGRIERELRVFWGQTRYTNNTTCVAPVLVVPRVFEPEFCRTLIDYYESRGGEPSGFMRDIDGVTTLVHDPAHKKRRDSLIDDEAVKQSCRKKIRSRLLPEILRSFQFEATRIERYIVACYDASESGHFRRHRDNTTRGTAHRKFAVSINLNTGHYDGGLLRFPEFGSMLYEAPLGGAVVFSCSLLHEATPVVAGKRYAFLPFLYDETSAASRDANQKFMSRSV